VSIVYVRDGNLEQAMRALKKKISLEGVLRECRRRSYFECPSQKRMRKKAEAVRRTRKMLRRRHEINGF
jgi:small subunit ribosomal protein S21